MKRIISVGLVFVILLGLIIPIQVKAETSNINLNSLEVISEVSPLGDYDYDIYGYTATFW